VRRGKYLDLRTLTLYSFKFNFENKRKVCISTE